MKGGEERKIIKKGTPLDKYYLVLGAEGAEGALFS